MICEQATYITRVCKFCKNSLFQTEAISDIITSCCQAIRPSVEIVDSRGAKLLLEYKLFKAYIIFKLIIVYCIIPVWLGVIILNCRPLRLERRRFFLITFNGWGLVRKKTLLRVASQAKNLLVQLLLLSCNHLFPWLTLKSKNTSTLTTDILLIDTWKW